MAGVLRGVLVAAGPEPFSAIMPAKRQSQQAHISALMSKGERSPFYEAKEIDGFRWCNQPSGSRIRLHLQRLVILPRCESGQESA